MFDTENVETAAPETESGTDRRGVLKGVGMTAAVGAIAAAGVTAAATVPAQAQTVTDQEILNFALNLEYLEAEFYLRAVGQPGLAATNTTGTGTQGTVTGGSLVPFTTSFVAQVAANLAADEQAHVIFLRDALGSAAVAEPTINFTTAFTTLAVAAGLITAGQTFNPFGDQVSFLLGAFVFEDVGVTAYAGAANLISNKTYLQAASSILAVEAYHAATVRTLLSSIGAQTAVQAISNLRGSLSSAIVSGQPDDAGIVQSNGNFNIAPIDSNALSFRRTTGQVLNIVYGGASTASGLFFPNGVNGVISQA